MVTQDITNANVVNQISRTLSKNSPSILTGLSVAGLIATVILAVKTTPKAMHILEREHEFRYDQGEADYLDTPIELLDQIELTWKCYIPALVMGAATVTCIIGSNSINMRRNAALASIFSITETTLREYQAKVVETIGEKKDEKIRAEIAEERMQKSPPQDNTIIMTGKGDYLCMDSYSGRYFRSDVETIRSAVNSFNQRLLTEGWMDINNFYERLDLPHIQLGDLIGWVAPTSMLDIRYSSAMSPKNEPVLVMEYMVNPKNMQW